MMYIWKSIYFPDIKLVETLEKEAREQSISLSALVVAILEEYLRRLQHVAYQEVGET